MKSSGIKKLIKTTLMRLFYLVRDKKKKSIYFSSFACSYSDSPKAISEAIHEIDDTIELVWNIGDQEEAPNYVKRISGSLQRKIAQAQANAWVLNNPSQLYDWKNPTLLFVQTYHGDRGFKLIGWAALEAMGADNVFFDTPDLSDVDWFTIGSDYGKKQAQEGLHYYGYFLPYGLPRNDQLVNIHLFSDKIKRIKEELSINSDVKVLLYAPTFRDGQNDKQKNLVDLNSCIQALESKGEKWLCLVKAHSVSKGIEIGDSAKIGYIRPGYDMADLLLISDCLITDYSSCAGDFILTKKPCVLAQFDINDYAEHSRALAFDPTKSGFIIAKSQNQLYDILTHIDTYDHEQISNKINSFYGTFETGKASYMSAKIILDWINTNS